MIVFDRQAVKESVVISEGISLVEDCFRWVETPRIEQMNPHTFNLDRPSSQYGYGLLATYQAIIKPYGIGGVKWLGEYLKNSSRGLPNSAAVNVISDLETALPLAILDGGPVTEYRTAASAVVGAKYLASPDPTAIGIVGCGRQGQAHLEAMNDYFDLSEVYLYDHHEENQKQFERIFRDLNLEIITTQSPREAVRGTDIVCTVSTSSEPIVESTWLPAGCHVAATAGFKDLDASFSSEADKWYLGWHGRDRNWIEGEEQGMYGPRTLSLSDVDGDLAGLVRRNQRGRDTEDERTLMTHMGMPALDVAFSNHVYRSGLENGTKKHLSLFDWDSTLSKET